VRLDVELKLDALDWLKVFVGLIERRSDGVSQWSDLFLKVVDSFFLLFLPPALSMVGEPTRMTLRLPAAAAAATSDPGGGVVVLFLRL
jgi:hypothetical protein